MRTPPTPSRELLEALVRKGAARGIPVQEAEDLVMEAWERSVRAWDPARGSFDALLLVSAENAFRYWWRREVRERKRGLVLAHPAVEVASPPTGNEAVEAASARQERLLGALDDEERRVFFAWALQHHLPRGQLNARAAARSLGMAAGAYDHAKRRLKARIFALLDDLGLTPRDLLTVDDDERPARRA